MQTINILKGNRFIYKRTHMKKDKYRVTTQVVRFTVEG